MKRFCGRLAALKLWDYVWALFVMLLPLTSVPVIVKLVRSDVVAAPSALLLPLLLAGYCLPLLVTGRHFPECALPLTLFVLAALTATAVSFFYQIPDYKGLSPVSASASAVITVFIGFSFYLVSLLRHNSEERLNFTLRLVSISGVIVCVWTLLQAVCWYRFHRYPEWMRNIQFSLSIGSLYRQRFVGFTLEPSWLAHQMNLLYLPFWFAASLTGYSAFRKRGRFITVERVLFFVGIVVLFLTLSRVGLAAFLLTGAFSVLVLVRRGIRKFAGNFPKNRQRLIKIAAVPVVILLFAGAAFGVLRFLMRQDFRMAGLFDIQVRGRSDPVFYFAEKLSLAARFVYWDGGFSVFNEHPFLGVGLGHAGFYLPGLLNDYAFRLAEVRDLLYRSMTLLNIKSLWIRILAETGIVGFTFFFVWYLRSLLSSAVQLNSDSRLRATVSWMGCFVLLAFLLEGFSLDTFALPYLWFSIGLVSAVGEITE